MYYYYLDQRRIPQGPYTAAQIRALLMRGAITGNTLVAAAGHKSWQPLAYLQLVDNDVPRPMPQYAQDYYRMGPSRPNIAERVYSALQRQAAMGEMPLRTTRFVLSIISIVFALFLLDNADTISKFASLGKAFGVDMDIATGSFLGLCHLASGIVGICAYAKRSPGCLIASSILLVLGIVFSLDVGRYKDLYVYDFITAGFAAVYWIAMFKSLDSGNRY